VTVVSDTGPLNYLLLIEAIDLVPALYGPLLVPDVVAADLRHPGAPAAVRSWISRPPAWASLERTAGPLNIPGLDPGEEATLSLAQERHIALLLMDERKGRQAATARGLRVTGTLGVVEAAAARGLISLPDALRRLQQTSFRATPALYEALLVRSRTVK